MKRFILVTLLSIYSTTLLAQTEDQTFLLKFLFEVGCDTYSQVIDNGEWDITVNGDALCNTNGKGKLINEIFGLQFGETFYCALNKIKNNKNNYCYEIHYDTHNNPIDITLVDVYYAGYHWDMVMIYISDVRIPGDRYLAVSGISFLSDSEIEQARKSIYKKYLSQKYSWICYFEKIDIETNTFCI